MEFLEWLWDIIETFMIISYIPLVFLVWKLITKDK